METKYYLTQDAQEALEALKEQLSTLQALSALEQLDELIAHTEAQREADDIHHCVRCGREILYYEDTEFPDDRTELRLTYKCPCGFYGEQVYSVVYEGTQEIE